MRRAKRKIILIFGIITILLTLFPSLENFDLSNLNAKDIVTSLFDDSDGNTFVDGELEVHFINVGQGDCILIRQGAECMLIDGGDNDQGTAVQKYLQDEGVEELKYIIASHTDADHIGGLDVVITKFDTGKVLMPDYQANTRTYEDFMNAIEYKRVKTEYPGVGTTYTLGDATFEVIYVNENANNANDTSLSILLTYGETSFMFCGDISTECELKIVSQYDVDIDVLKSNHHGSMYSNSTLFFEDVDAEYIVISCGVDNSYGHPHKEALNRMEAYGFEIYRTDQDGDIVFYSDGEEIIDVQTN